MLPPSVRQNSNIRSSSYTDTGISCPRIRSSHIVNMELGTIQDGTGPSTPDTTESHKGAVATIVRSPSRLGQRKELKRTTSPTKLPAQPSTPTSNQPYSSEALLSAGGKHSAWLKAMLLLQALLLVPACVLSAVIAQRTDSLVTATESYGLTFIAIAVCVLSGISLLVNAGLQLVWWPSQQRWLATVYEHIDNCGPTMPSFLRSSNT